MKKANFRVVKKNTIGPKYFEKNTNHYLVKHGSIFEPTTMSRIKIKNKMFKNIVEFVKMNPTRVQAAYHMAYYQLLSQNTNLYYSDELRELELDRDFKIEAMVKKSTRQESFNLLFKYDSLDKTPRAADAAIGLKLALKDFQLELKNPDAVLGVDYIERLLSA